MATDNDLVVHTPEEHVPTMMELVVEELARSEAALVERVAILEHDRDIYADMAKRALDDLRLKSTKCARLEALSRALGYENRALRQALVASETARRIQQERGE